jgi:hypothetical protein
MARFTVIISPKCIQLMLNASSMGRNTGPRIIVAEMMSMNMPTISSMIFMATRKTAGDVMADRTVSVILPGMLSNVSSLPKQVAPATIISSVAEVTAELIGNLFNLAEFH